MNNLFNSGKNTNEVMALRLNKNNKKKEKIIMLTSSALVLTALTMTGVYVKEKNDIQNDGAIIDFSQLENQISEKTNDIAKNMADNSLESPITDIQNDLDYDPNYLETDSDRIENENLDDVPGEETPAEDENGQQPEEADAKADDGEAALEAGSNSVAQAITFGERDTLQWPLVGNVLLNYSMDKAIYFSTLDQYKYNPAIIIAAVEGEPITAAASGTVVSIYYDDEIGNALTMDLGGGYELTYGQLKDITMEKGDTVSAGDILGYVASPTKYYSVEGCNVYFKLTKDGIPMNPMNRLV